MMWRQLLMLCIGAGMLPAQPPLPEIDTVQVSPVFLKCTDNAGGVYKYRGKVAYRLIGWSYDRFTVAMSIVNEGTGEIVPLTMVKGDIGAVTRPGDRSIHFTCQFNGPPSCAYRAKVSIIPARSDTAQAIENVIASWSNAEKQDLINNTGLKNIPKMVWQDGSYGVRGGYAWPCGEAMASTWDTALAEEGGVYKGQDFRAFGFNMMLGPSINIVRDGRDGLAAESYGEDPFVNGKFAAADLRGALRSGVMAALKHYCCSEECRAEGPCPIVVSERSIRETYTVPFAIAVEENAAACVMTAAFVMVNRTRVAQNSHLVNGLLKNSLGFRGIVVSDWDNGGGSFATTAPAGLDLPLPNTWGGGLTPLVPATLPQYLFDDKARRMLWSRYRAGWFEAGYTPTNFKDSVDNATHYAYMRHAARAAMILAKNDGGLLPLDKSKPLTVALVGPWADELRRGPVGSSQLNPKHATSPRQAVQKIGGANVTVTSDYAAADYAVVCVGPDDKGEGSDRIAVSLPDSQDQLVARVLAAKPGRTIVYYTGGSCADSGAWSKAPAIIMSFYPGEDHPLAMAEALFGDCNPGGKTPFTFPADSTQMPRFGVQNYMMTPADTFENVSDGRGYPFYERYNLNPLFCFGHGLSYTTFQYVNLQIAPQSGFPGDTFIVKVDVRNTGLRAGDEVVQLYLRDRASALPRRVKELRGFARVPLAAGETKTVSFHLVERDFEYYDDRESAWVVEPGPFDVLVGSSSQDIRQSGVITMR
jgi:beta-glucosidase